MRPILQLRFVDAPLLVRRVEGSLLREEAAGHRVVAGVRGVRGLAQPGAPRSLARGRLGSPSGGQWRRRRGLRGGRGAPLPGRRRRALRPRGAVLTEHRHPRGPVPDSVAQEEREVLLGAAEAEV